MVYDVRFKGLEWRLEDVAHKMDGNCPRSKGAGVTCKGYRIQTRKGASVTSGEVFINGQPIYWSGWGLTDANTDTTKSTMLGVLEMRTILQTVRIV